MFDFVKRSSWYFLISTLIVVAGVVSLLAPGGLKLGIEFTSGSTMTIQFEESVSQEGLRESLRELGYPEAIIQRLGGGAFFVRLKEIGAEEKEAIEEALTQRFGPAIGLEFTTVSPVVAREIGRNTGIAIAIASLGILLYIAFAFRRVPHSFRWGSCAVVALVHDALVVLGIFSILGRLFNIQIDALFVTAILAVVGYSVNNAVVVFDRLRENLSLGLSPDFATVVNQSLTETLSRNLNTNLTTLFVLFSLLLFGGLTIHNFILALVIGVIGGLYSSLLIAPQLLVVWERMGKKS